MSSALDAMVKAMAEELAKQGPLISRYDERTSARLPGIEFGGPIDLEKVARAGLAAIREPTAPMIQTACQSHTPGVEMQPGWGECPKQKNAAFRWRAMIDKILEEKA